MNLLSKNNVPLYFVTAYVGIDKNFITVNETLKVMDSTELKKLDSLIIEKIFSFDDFHRDEFLFFLLNDFEITEEKYAIANKIWIIGYLKNILNNEKTITDKLKEIEYVWSIFGYPNDWKKFIYYMPVEENAETGEKIVYDKFIAYFKKENEMLDEYLKSIEIRTI